jgi:hypothetical protein
MIPNDTYKSLILIFGLASIIFYGVYKHLYNPIVFHTSVGKNGHLVWEWLIQDGWENIFLIIVTFFI